jgi:hypothetical protein
MEQPHPSRCAPSPSPKTQPETQRMVAGRGGPGTRLRAFRFFDAEPSMSKPILNHSPIGGRRFVFRLALPFLGTQSFLLFEQPELGAGACLRFNLGDFVLAAVNHRSRYAFDLREHVPIAFERGQLPCELLLSHDHLVDKSRLNFYSTTNPADRLGGSKRRTRTEEWLPHHAAAFGLMGRLISSIGFCVGWVVYWEWSRHYLCGARGNSYGRALDAKRLKVTGTPRIALARNATETDSGSGSRLGRVYTQRTKRT